MRITNHILAGAAICGIIGFLPASAMAQSAPATSDADIVVTGIRASLQSAQSLKRNSGQIVDSIVAEDIGKLPDVNVTEALQRVSGIQIGRDRGEGSGITIRGLSQVISTFNGRTGGSGRGVDLENIPSELIAGVDVYKTPSANLIEGGIGGLIDVRTRKPLDKKGFVLSGSARARYSELPDKVKPLLSALISNTWDVGDGGEFGILVSGSYQERAFQTDSVNVGAPVERRDIIPGQIVAAPNGSYQPAIASDRRRIGIDGVIQYKPTPDLEFYVQGTYQDANSIQEQYGLFVQTRNRTPIAGTAQLFPGTNDVKSISYANVPFTTFAAARESYEESFQLAGGVKYDSGPFHLAVDGAYTKSNGQLYYREMNLAGTAPRVDQDVSTAPGTLNIRNFDLNDPNSYTLGALGKNVNLNKSDAKQLRADATFDIESSFLKSMHFGVRWSDAKTRSDQLRFSNTAINNGRSVPASPFANMLIPNPLNDMFNGTTAIDQNFLVFNPQLLREDFEGVRNQLGVTQVPAFNPLFGYRIGERTMAGYVMGTFEIDGPVRIDGNAGIRVIRTDLNLAGSRALFTQRPGTGTAPGNPPVFEQTGIAPVVLQSSYTTPLPSANIRFRFTDQLQLRLAASKVLTRPSFNQLSPTLSLVPVQQTGTAGNPDLKPLKADQLDASLEYYFSPTASVYVAGFYRKVKGFIQNTTSSELIDGVDYQITRPVNGNDGKIKGFEIGGQTFFDFLPGLLSGFGVQANYTFVDSNAPSSVAGLFTPLPNLSKHSYNASLIYEKGPLSARLAYNWRKRFYSSLYSSGAIALNSPVFTKSRSWLDASIGYDITDQVTVTLEGSNLLKSKTETYFTDPTRPGNIEQDTMAITAGVRFTL